MKLFFASDLHGSLPMTDAVLTAFKQSGANTLILLGDILNHGPRNPVPEGYDPVAVAERLNQVSDSIIAVRGNCDSEVDQMLLRFPMMTDYSWVLLESGQRIFLTHGHLYNATKKPQLKVGDIIAHGHTHIPVAQFEESNYIFNPGSVTFPREGFPSSVGVYDDGLLQVMTLDNTVIVQAETKMSVNLG